MAAASSLDRGEGLRELTPPSLAHLLRTATAAAHRDAEGGAFLRRMAAGRLPLAAWRDWVGQLLRLQEALERALWRDWQDPSWRELTAADRRRSRQLGEDLRALGGYGAPAARKALQPLLDGLAADGDPPAWSLGVLYVLEGSSNGGRMLARPLADALGRQDGSGLSHLDPYGAAQAERWRSFRVALDQALPETRWQAALDGALAAFAALGALGVELCAAHDDPAA